MPKYVHVTKSMILFNLKDRKLKIIKMRTDIRGINQSVWLSDISQCDMFNIRFTVVEDTNHGRPNKLYTMTHHLFQRNAVSMSPTICRGARACRTHIYYQAGQATINYQPSNMKSIRTGNMIVRH